jgi:hypothetical protein
MSEIPYIHIRYIIIYPLGYPSNFQSFFFIAPKTSPSARARKIGGEAGILTSQVLSLCLVHIWPPLIRKTQSIILVSLFFFPPYFFPLKTHLLPPIQLCLPPQIKSGSRTVSRLLAPLPHRRQQALRRRRPFNLHLVSVAHPLPRDVIHL